MLLTYVACIIFKIIRQFTESCFLVKRLNSFESQFIGVTFYPLTMMKNFRAADFLAVITNISLTGALLLGALTLFGKFIYKLKFFFIHIVRIHFFSFIYEHINNFLEEV